MSVKVYISASWKQRERVRALAVALRDAGHEVYDFTDPACRRAITGRECQEIPPEQFPEQFDPALHVYREYIAAVPQWRAAVEGNRQALRWCDAVVLLLPAGADSHADWALAVGMGKKTAVVGEPRAGDRTPSHLWADALLVADVEVPGWLATVRAATGTDACLYLKAHLLLSAAGAPDDVLPERVRRVIGERDRYRAALVDMLAALAPLRDRFAATPVLRHLAPDVSALMDPMRAALDGSGS